MAKKGGKIVGKSELAEIFGISEPTVDNWIKRGAPVEQRGGRGVAWQLNTAKITEWLKRREVENATGGEYLDENKLRHQRLVAETAKIQLDLEKAKGNLVPLPQLERVLANVFAEIKTNLRNVPSRVVTSLVGEADETLIKKVLLAEIDLALLALDDFDVDENEGLTDE